jgi:outer membrane assembly lipoprotein YfiO
MFPARSDPTGAVRARRGNGTPPHRLLPARRTRPSRGARPGAARLALVALGALVALLALCACGAPGKHLPVGTYERGEAEFHGKRYTLAIEDLKLFVRRNPKDPSAAQAQFLVAQCYMEAKEYALSAVEYEILRNDYPNTDLADDAFFLEGISYARQRPNYRLDQKVTQKAVEHFQKYLAQFPTGRHREQTQQELDALELHLARKRLEQARQYWSLRQYGAAALVLDDLLEASKESTLRPDMLLLRGRVALRQHDSERARTCLGEVLSRYPQHPTAGAAKELMHKLGQEAGAGGGGPGSESLR